MQIDVRPCSGAEDFARALGAIGHYGGTGWPRPDAAERFARVLPHERMHAARADGEIVGGSGAFPFLLSVPGGRDVACAGVTVVGVLPTHRRRGILRELMRAEIDTARANDEPVALLWASEETIYGRFGFGLASLAAEIDLPREHAAFAAPPPGRGSLRLVDADAAAQTFPLVYERVRERTPGMVTRTPDWWQLRRVADAPDAKGPVLNRVLLELDGRAAGYALYRIHSRWEAGVPQGHLEVIEAIADAPEAEALLWRYLLDLDWVGSIRADLLPVDHPLLHLLATPRRMRMSLWDGLWVRLVDVERAFAARSLADGAELVVDLADAFCPWNEGRWRLDHDGATRTDAEPDLRLDVQALGSAFLGGFTTSALARAGRVEELRPGGLARADVLLRGERAPWCPEIF